MNTPENGWDKPTEGEWHPLDDPREQLTAARTHFDTLHKEALDFLEKNPELKAPPHYMEGGKHVIKISELPVLPKRWGVMYGEVGNAARTALDYLIYELSFAGGGNPDKDRTAFPISIDRDEYWRKNRRGISYRDRCLAGVADEWKRKIDDLQPYNRTKFVETHPLVVLNQLSNRQKHQTAHAASINIETPGGFLFIRSRYTVRDVTIRCGDDDMEIETAMWGGDRVPRPGDWSQRFVPKSERGGETRFGLVFGTNDYTGLGDLINILDHVEKILIWFEPAFEPAAK